MITRSFSKSVAAQSKFGSQPPAQLEKVDVKDSHAPDQDQAGAQNNPTLEQLPSSTLTTSAKRRRSTRLKAITEPVFGSWDVLPHGIGKKGNLLDGAAIDQQTATKEPSEPLAKRVKANEDAKPHPEPQSATSFVTAGLLQENQPDEHGNGSTAVEPEIVKIHDDNLEIKLEPEGGDLQEETGINTSTAIPKKVKEPIISSSKTAREPRKPRAAKPTKARKPKKLPYGLSPGISPFPNHVMPTPEACEKVHRLLSGLHGEVIAPTVITPPSMETTGCGEVPDMLDALLRTRLSANTSQRNSDSALAGLKKEFGLRTWGSGMGSINWEAVRNAKLERISNAIRSGGLAEIKSADIKKILDIVYEKNSNLLDALVEEEETAQPTQITGENDKMQEKIDAKIAKLRENMLAMDYVFELADTNEVMETLVKFPGIGVKTASCVILFNMQRPSFAVDTHVWRHCKWLGWVPPKATRDQTFSHCEVRVPNHLKYGLHQLFLRHGKTCGRCRGNASFGSAEWNNTVCPIENLVNRTETRKSCQKCGGIQG